MIPFFDSKTLETRLPMPRLIEALRMAFQTDFHVPPRHHHAFSPPNTSLDSTLLLMPAWDAGAYLGVKTVIVSPENRQIGKPSIQGIYTLFDQKTGAPLAQMDAPALTALRTAATSALAASYLARSSADSLLVIGTGALAPWLIRAHAAIRPIRKVWIWGRNFEHAQKCCARLRLPQADILPVRRLKEVLPKADIISCATLSKTPLVEGKYLRAGQHLDLVGSYKPDMREADDEVVKKAVIYADILENAIKESGDLAIPLKSGILRKEDLRGDLPGLCRGQFPGRENENDITLFKSVGHALEDLAAAILAY
ncbi:MAG: ornithine cyclodeaminase family protein, partial [Bacteroidetes bacterium]